MLEVSNEKNAVVITITEPQLQMYLVPMLRDKVSDILAENPPMLIIDLSQVDFVDSSGMGVLLQFHKKITANGGNMLLSGVNERIHTIFKITKSDRHFTIFETLKQALESL